MKEYIRDVFTSFGCTLRQEDNVLAVDLTPELKQRFGKPTLRLVFHPEHAEKQTELVTHGSYITSRLYEELKYLGEKVSVLLPKCEEIIEHVPPAGVNCQIIRQRSRAIRNTESYIVFRITYYSDEKREEIVIISIDFKGNVEVHTGFPYTQTVLKDALPYRFPFTQKHAKILYDKCLREVSQYAEQQAVIHQETLARHFHENITRLEAYYRQMIEEIPAVEKDHDMYVRQLQEEYEIKTHDELAKCQVQVTITPISFCTITIPFCRYQYTFQTDRITGNGQKVKGERPSSSQRSAFSVQPPSEVTVEVYHNLFAGKEVLPRCDACDHDMKQIGICEVKSHPVCHNCLVQCHECGKYVCRDCGVDVCFECGEWVCHACSKRCHICGERYCTRHLLGCLVCREHFCRQCSELCEICGKPVGKIHLTACEISYKLACPACTMVCSCCRKHVNQTLISYCAFCGQQACVECMFRCAVCGEAFCVHHVTECELTHQMTCPRHSGKCDQCGRRVSTAHLNTCDVCGITVCTKCSTQCHHCGIFFCEKHAEEMLSCPECGEMYCVLCYSGQGLCEECREKGRR